MTTQAGQLSFLENANGVLTVSSTASSVSSSTGALIVAGGAGIAGNLYVGGNLNIGGSSNITITGSISTATNLGGGAAGQLVYQSAFGVTGYLGPGTSGQILVSAGTSAPVYTNTSSIIVGFAGSAGSAATATNLAGGAAGSLVIQSGLGATTMLPIGTSGYVLQSNGATATWVSTASLGIGGGSVGSISPYSGIFTVTNVAVSTSTTTGALQVAGGIGAGGRVTASSMATTSITSYPTGSNANILINPDGTGNVQFSAGTQIIIYNTATSVSTVTGALTVAGGVGVQGNLYATAIYDSTKRVLTEVSAVAGTGITITGVDNLAPVTSFTINNNGVLSLTGTASQVLVNGTSGSATTGTITLTLPQSIATSSSPTFTGLTLSGAAPGLSFTNATSNWISWNTAGVAAPSITTSSPGTKLLLYPGVSGSQVDYAVGIASSTLWNSVPGGYAQFQWFANTSSIMVLTGAGNLGIGTTSPVNNAGYGGLTLNGTTGGIGSFSVGGTETFRTQVVSTYAQLNAITAIPLVFNTNNTERVRILSGGNVGIGTSTPQRLLHVGGGSVLADALGSIGQYDMVAGSASTWYNAGWRNDGSSVYFLGSSVQTTQASAFTATYNNYRPFTYNLGTGAVSIDSGSSLGGTTIGGTLGVTGAATFSSTLSFTNTLYGNSKEALTTSDTYLRINQSAAFSSGSWFGASNVMMGGGTFAVGSNGGTTTSKFYITGNYNGTNNINIDSDNARINIGTAGSSSLNITGYNAYGGTGYQGFLTVTNTYGSATNPNKYFRINSIGDLQIVNSVYNAVLFALSDAGAVTAAGSITASSFSGAGTGLTGTAASLTAGSVSSIPNASTQISSLGVGTAASGTTGEIRATNNITSYYSDQRLKTNIVTIPNALDKVLKISGVTFTANETAATYGYTDSKLQVGVIAQEVEAVLPEIVVPAPFDIGKNEDGTEYSLSGENYKTVQYDKLVPLLIQAIKELKAEVDELRSQKG